MQLNRTPVSPGTKHGWDEFIIGIALNEICSSIPKNDYFSNIESALDILLPASPKQILANRYRFVMDNQNHFWKISNVFFMDDVFHNFNWLTKKLLKLLILMIKNVNNYQM